MLYHGTIHSFDRFEQFPVDRNTPSPTNKLGVFLSTCPRIAAHFTLKDEVIDAGYDSDTGSRTLREDPWQFDADPFLDNAAVLHCSVAMSNPVQMGALQWLAIVEERDEASLLSLRGAWLDAGYDGVIIDAWDGTSEHPDYGKPCVEMHEKTYLVFDAQNVAIHARQPAAQVWHPSRPSPRP